MSIDLIFNTITNLFFPLKTIQNENNSCIFNFIIILMPMILKNILSLEKLKNFIVILSQVIYIK